MGVAVRHFVMAMVATFLISSLPDQVFAKKSGGKSSHTTRVRGYTKKDGTYVTPHRRTSTNHTKKDNWSHRGNINPDTGKVGTLDD